MYDFIVVGGGSAGCVLAARLSEDPGSRVLLLEAGPPDDLDEIRVPAATMGLWYGPLSWNDATVPQPHAADRSIPWARGRVLGGGSSINGMVYIRGNPLDYDTWLDRFGCTGWGYADLLPYFLRAEDQERGASAYHGAEGPLRVEDPRYLHPLSRAWVAAARAYGLAANDDFNAAAQEGAGYFQHTARTGRRWSAVDGYLRPAMKHDNLSVRTGVLVSRILFDGDRAAGVRYLQDGTEHEVRTRGEVVLSAGAVGSPHLLMLSGIGPAGHLREHGIAVAVDAPEVGGGLQDHPVCAPIWRTPDIRNLWEEVTAENRARWERDGRGPMASLGAEAFAFDRTRKDLPAPDVGYGPVPAPVDPSSPGPPTWRGMSVLVMTLDVASRGRVSLRSADPRDKAVIDPAYLAAEADLDALVAGVRTVREITECQPLAGMVAGEYLPGDRLDNDDQIRDWVRGKVWTMHHPVGSCAMGTAPTTVCDASWTRRSCRRSRAATPTRRPSPSQNGPPTSSAATPR